MEWRSTPRAQESIEAVGSAVADEFGDATKEEAEGPLSRGYVGTAIDDDTQSLVIVVDPKLVNMHDLSTKLRAAAGTDGVAVRVEAARVGVPTLIEAGEVIAARDWHPNASRVAMAFWLDPATCRYNVTFGKGSEDVAAALQTRLGDLVRIRWGAPQRRSGSQP
jgi:hypothetical protein